MTELERLKLMAEEHGGTEACPLPRMYTDQELEQLLELGGTYARYYEMQFGRPSEGL